MSKKLKMEVKKGKYRHFKGKEYEVIGGLQDLDTRRKGIKKKTLSFNLKDNQLALLPPTFLLRLSKLLDMNFEEWTNEIERMIPSYGQTMNKSASDAFESGDITKRHYLLLTGGGA